MSLPLIHFDMNSYWDKEKLVLGCGNTLFGDDGFGPEVIEYLKANFNIPPDIGVIDAGIGVREILFNLALSEKRPKLIIIVDAVDLKRVPGEVFEIDINQIPEIKIDDFSMHQLPTSNLLRELQDYCGVEINIVSAQIEHIPEEISPGLSNAVRASIPKACRKIWNKINSTTDCKN